MSFRYACVVCLFVTGVAVSASAARKSPGTLQSATDIPVQTIFASPNLSAAAACTVSSVSEIVYRMDGWVTGNELYKTYIDPASQCQNAYPFTVTAVNMLMYFAAPTQFVASVDIENVQMLTPTCPAPGVMQALSTDYDISVPSAGIWTIWIPLDQPVVVNGPFFAGFFIGSTIPSSAGAAVLIDNIPAPCHSFNIWDTTVGFVDLCNFPSEFGPDWNFPGRLVMEVAGMPGGANIDPVPQLRMLSPVAASYQYETAELWVQEISGSKSIDYVSFEYHNGTNWVEIGRDYDGTRPLRSNMTGAEPGNGYGLTWDFSSLPEMSCTIRATIFDTLGRSASAITDVYLEPTPPLPKIVSPDNGDGFCSPLHLLMQCSDANLQQVQVYRREASLSYSAGGATLNQQTLGNTNADATDGNHAAQGEFGDYYSGPAAATMAIRLWYDRGLTQLMQNGGAAMSTADVAEELAVLCKTRENLGTYDEDLYSGLQAYTVSHGDLCTADFVRAPDYWHIRNWAEEEQRAVMLGLGGTPGLWVTVDGFSGWEQEDGTWVVTISNPTTGTIQNVGYRKALGPAELFVNGAWHTIDIAVSLAGNAWTPLRSLVGADVVGADGWSFSWNPTGLNEDGAYFFRAVGKDSTNIKASSTVLLQYNCQGLFTAGDYDGDGNTDIADLMRLVSYLTKQGTGPVGGAARCDSNCDNVINLADAIYYMNYLLGYAAPPCY